jgi:hypothetical protein
MNRDRGGWHFMTGNVKRLACILIAIAAHAVIFVATDAGLRAVNAAIGSSRHADVGAVEWSHRYYYDYASQALSGNVPYRDFAFEYPILSYPLFLVPRLLAADFEGYRYAFMAEMFLFDVGAIVLIAFHGGEHVTSVTTVRRLGWFTVYIFLLAPLVIGRFELPPMLLAFAATVWWFKGRSVAGAIAAALGTLLKVFPGAVAFTAIACEIARISISRLRGTILFVAALAVGLAAWFALAGRHFLESLGYHAGRGLEIESLYGGALFLAGVVRGTKAPWVFDHNSYHIAPGWGASLALLALPIQAVALLAVVWQFRRSGMTDGLRYSAAAVLAFIVFGKVLSPQYLIWLFPFTAVLEGETGSLVRKIFLVACLTTALIYPGPGFPMVLDHQAGAILLLNVRNVLLVWMLVVLGFGHERQPTGSASAGLPQER